MIFPGTHSTVTLILARWRALAILMTTALTPKIKRAKKLMLVTQAFSLKVTIAAAIRIVRIAVVAPTVFWRAKDFHSDAVMNLIVFLFVSGAVTPSLATSSYRCQQ